jgi:hypothetical protein
MGTRRGAFRDVIVLSDTHCGSVYGLWPPDFHAADGRPLALNTGQQYLWECWLHLRDEVRKHYDPVAIVFNGDAVDGSAYRTGGHDLMTVERNDQVEAFERCMEVFTAAFPGVPLYFVQGTEYHDARSASALDAAAKALGAVAFRGLGVGRYSREVLDLDIGGVILNFAHHIGVSGGLYRTTALDREGVWAALAGKEGRVPKADVLIRAHAHYFAHVEHSTKHIVINPCWQLQTRYMRRHSVYRMLPDIGGTVIRIANDASPGGDRLKIEKHLYPLPEYRPTVVRAPS